MVTKDGPYIVFGGLPIDKQIIGLGEDDTPEKWIKGQEVSSGESCALCRCGASEDKPFCDGTHGKVGFDGTETATTLRIIIMIIMSGGRPGGIGILISARQKYDNPVIVISI